MRELRETVSLDVPQRQAEECILAYFERSRTPGGVIEIPLHVMLGDFGIPGDLLLGRTVTVHLSKRRDAQNLNDEIAIRWDPGEHEPFPSFSGSMVAWSEKPGTTLVELRGTYEPPLGTAGRLFDDAIGHVIAKRTARQFLLTLAEGAQTCFHK